MDTSYGKHMISKTSPRGQAAQKLLDAAQEFWKECNKAGQFGAVQWLQGDDRSLVVFTRGEYRHQLLSQIPILPGVAPENMFSEEIEADDD
jgi:hypothetical protein